jgi:hypothetical protein
MALTFKFGWMALVLIFMTGCASVSVREAKVTKRGPEKLPKHIYVSTFSTKGATFNVDREDKELEEFKKDTALVLQAALVERLPVLAPSKKAPAVLPSQGWLIQGKFVRVNQGSRALRTGIGFGAGATKLETQVKVYDLARSSTSPFLSFNTTGGSNAEPGAISGIGPLTWFTVVGLGVGGVGNAMHGLTEDSERTAREIRNHLVDYCIAKKMVSKEWAKTVRFSVDDPRSSGSK